MLAKLAEEPGKLLNSGAMAALSASLPAGGPAVACSRSSPT